jgi:type II secretory pathway component PulF
MAMFRYRALTDGGRLMEGTVEAAGTQQAQEMLAAMNLTVQELETAEAAPPAAPVGRDEFLLFNQQLASITKAGIPLEQGLRQLAQDAGSARMRHLIEEIARDLESGMSIEQAVGAREKAFPPLYGLILKAGVRTGRLSEMLTSLNRHLEIGQRTRRILAEAVTYPAVVFFICVVIVTFMFVFIVPTYKEVLTDMAGMGSGLPALTEIFITLSHYIVHIWIGILALLLISVFSWRGLSYTAAGRKTKEAFLFRVPYLGRVLQNGFLARLAESMGLLAAAGCTMPQCLRLGGQASGSETLRRDMEHLAAQVEAGGSVLEAGPMCRKTPMLFLYSMQLGIQRNELINHMQGLGRMYAQRTSTMQAHLQAVLAPALIIFLGIFVGTMVLALFLPLIKMVQVLM